MQLSLGKKSVTSDQKGTPVGKVYAGFTANVKTFFVAPEGYWRVLDRERLSIDALGVRIWHLDNSLDLLSTTVANVTVGRTQGWADPILGARFRLNLDKGWSTNLIGDAGGFAVGSQVTWQLYGGIGKEFKKKYSYDRRLSLFGRRLSEWRPLIRHPHERPNRRVQHSLKMNESRLANCARIIG